MLMARLTCQVKNENNKNLDIQAKRIIHVIFSGNITIKIHGTVLINRQINNHPVAVCYRIRSLLKYLDPRIFRSQLVSALLFTLRPDDIPHTITLA